MKEQKKEQKRKSFFYKKASFTKPMDGETLQSVLSGLLATHKFPARRKEPLASDEQTFHFINYNGKHGLKGKPSNFLGVELFSYTHGADQSTFKLDENKTELDVSSLLPPDENDQFLNGALYFGVLRNDVVVMQSSAVRTYDLERHLNWLFKCFSVVEDGNILHLEDAPPEQGSANYKDAKAIKISSPVVFDSLKGGRKIHTPEASVENVQLKPKGPGWDALKAILSDYFMIPDHLNAESILESHKLKVELQLKWVKTPQGDTSELMTSIAHNLRNIDEEIDYVIETKNGPITRDQFKVKFQSNIQWKDGRPALDQLFPAMLDWLDSLKASGRVKA